MKHFVQQAMCVKRPRARAVSGNGDMEEVHCEAASEGVGRWEGGGAWGAAGTLRGATGDALAVHLQLQIHTE